MNKILRVRTLSLAVVVVAVPWNSN